MSALPAGGRLLGDGVGLPPKEQRILAPSLVAVIDSDMGNKRCACALQITDVVNLTLYYVPMTSQMVYELRKSLAQYDGHIGTTNNTEEHAA